MKKIEKIILAGGSGFLGSLLAKYFSEQGNEVVILSRKEFSSPYAKVLLWNGETLSTWSEELEGSLAVINLAGKSVDCRYTKSNCKKLMDSRILSTKVIGKAIKACKNPPKVWLNSSTATIYEHTYGKPHSEGGRIAASPDAKDEFSIELASAWEEEFNNHKTPQTRKVLLRTALVFNKGGSVYQVLRRLTLFGLGGKMGHGKQKVSWIHSYDFLKAVAHIISDEKASGIYNISAPNPLSNNEMMETLRKENGIPFGLPSPKWMLELGAIILRTETELIIKSRNVVPTRLLNEGFEFKYEYFKDSLD